MTPSSPSYAPPTFPTLLDAEAAIVEHWGVRGLPTTYVIDRRDVSSTGR